MSDAMSDWQAIDNGFTPQANKDQEKYWKAWQRYAAIWNIEPFIQGCNQLDIIIFVTDFSAWVRKGYYGKIVQIKVPNVAEALSAITTSIHLVGRSFPLNITEDNYRLVPAQDAPLTLILQYVAKNIYLSQEQNQFSINSSSLFLYQINLIVHALYVRSQYYKIHL